VLDDRHDIRDPVLALTFDGGPSVWTEQILDLLESYDLGNRWRQRARDASAHPRRRI
jgi:hypothetical protein